MTNPIQPDQVLVRYGEIGLKSPGVRRHLEILLRKHLGFILVQNQAAFDRISQERGRFFIHTNNPIECAQAAARVFGIVSTSPVWTVPSSPNKIIEMAQLLTPHILRKGQSFAVRARRLKIHPFTSQEIASQVGAAIIQAATNAKKPVSVDLKNPDVEVNIEIRQKSTYFFTEVFSGPGGLPYGSQGSVIGLHSGGIDSPVAQWLIMKRGARLIPLYFDTDQTQTKQIRKRAINAAKILANWIPERKTDLLSIPFHSILKEFKLPAHPKITCILCKRMMYRISAMVAAQKGARALVTGEMLGQVASQTLTNLRILDSSIDLPVFRPLIGLDKTDVMTLARQIGTYDVSSQDVGDCFAVPQQPTIAAELEEVHRAESILPIAEMVEQALSQMEQIPLE